MDSEKVQEPQNALSLLILIVLLAEFRLSKQAMKALD